MVEERVRVRRGGGVMVSMESQGGRGRLGFACGVAGRVVGRQVRWCLAVCCVVVCVGLVVGAPGVSAFASIEGPPYFSSAPGLPDGRVYEQVSPADKNGNEAGAGTAPFRVGAKNHYGVASPDGDAVLFEGTGPMGESPSDGSLWFVATKNSGAAGWSTHALLPAVLQQQGTLRDKGFTYIDPSQDLSHVMAEFGNGTLAPQTNEGCVDQIDLAGPDPFVLPVWIERPGADLASPIENCEQKGLSGAPVGGSPDFSTVYFGYAGTLLPEDASRAPHTTHSSEEDTVEAWGFYEYTGGVLREGGVLPDGSVSAFGAVPAASGHGRDREGNEVSVDGSRAFFVSPDPASCEANGGHNDCAVDPPELYVREDGVRTLLVSRDTLLAERGGLPAAAPSGVLAMANPSWQVLPAPGLDGSFVFASPDGSQAFFQSGDALTEAAQEASPGSEAKTYDFDVDTGALTYLPGVVGEILATDSDGSSMAFVRPEEGGEPAELELWSAGPGGGVAPVARLGSVPEARMSSDGSVLVFQTGERVSGSFNSGGDEEIYRYDVPGNSLGCVSCPPAGIVPGGNASLSMLHTDEVGYVAANSIYEPSRVPVDSRGVSAGGERVFFESPDPLVPQDSNTGSPPALVEEDEARPQGRDVYEWEDGVVYLISTGTSTRDSYLLDSSENGDDVFFATAQSLVPGDTDGGYDVYDARVPRAEDSPPPAASACEGSSCQGSAGPGPSVVVSGRASFSGGGNPVPEVVAPVVAKPTPKVAKCRKGYVKKKDKCVKGAAKKAKKASGAAGDRGVRR